MRDALQHTFPEWQEPTYNDGSRTGDDAREVWFGVMRVVSAKRARVLRKRGVPLMPLHAVRDVQASTLLGGRRYEPTTPNGRARYAWFERKDDADTRKARRGGRCYNTYREACAGRVGRRYELAEALQEQRAAHQAERWFRTGGKLAASYFYQTNTYYGTPHVANPQLDLYARAFELMQIDTATGAALDALCKLPFRPEGMTDAELRDYVRYGYALRCTPASYKPDEPRMSPNMSIWLPASYAGLLHENMVQTGTREHEAALQAAGYVPEGEGALADSYVRPTDEALSAATRLPAALVLGHSGAWDDSTTSEGSQRYSKD